MSPGLAVARHGLIIHQANYHNAADQPAALRELIERVPEQGVAPVRGKLSYILGFLEDDHAALERGLASGEFDGFDTLRCLLHLATLELEAHRLDAMAQWLARAATQIERRRRAGAAFERTPDDRWYSLLRSLHTLQSKGMQGIVEADRIELARVAMRGLLTDGCSPAAAMMKARREVRAVPQWTHPYYYALMQVLGVNTPPLFPASAPSVTAPRRWPLIVVAGLLGVMIALLLRVSRRRGAT